MSDRLTFLREHCQGDKGQMKLIIQLYLKKAPENIAKIRESLLAGDREMLRRTAHSMKPQMGYMGMSEGRKVAEKIEEACQSRMDLNDIAELVEVLAAHYETSFFFLNEALKDLDG